MGAKHLAAIGLAALSVVNWSSVVGLASDRTALRLSRYHTFFVLEGTSFGNPTTDRRIRSDLETALDARGWVDVPRDEAEAVVLTHAAKAGDRSYPSFYRGWGGWPWKDCPGANASMTKEYKVGTLVVDIFDAESKEPLWSGVAPNVAPANPDKSGRGVEQAITRMFRAFPASEPTGDEALAVNDDPLSSGADVPRIIFERAPAILVQIDGTPEYQEIDGTGLAQVINARPFIARDDDGIYYMRIGEGWMQAYSLTGMWSVAGTVPHGAEAALTSALHKSSPPPIDLLESPSLEVAVGQGAHAVPPAVHVSTTATTLIVTNGMPEFAPVDGTKLLYMKNTTSRVYQEPTDQELYVLASGQWYRAWTESGPWQHVPAEDLPADLAAQ
jgi:Domain of unknown function (DUF4136)